MRLADQNTLLHGSLRLLAICGVSLTLLAGSAEAQSPEAESLDDAARAAILIDDHLRAGWDAEGVTPAPRADDAEFLRRVYLDIAGRIPSVAEARAFLDDAAPDKRRRLIDELVDGPGYVVHFTRNWRRVLLPEAETDLQARFLVPGFEAWLRDQLVRNRPYDELVYELLTAPLQRGYNSPSAFYQAKDVQPENLAAATSRIFLGIRLECAQCHDHPFDDWNQKQFWEFAAFYEGIERSNQQDGVLAQLRELFARRGLTIPETDQVVSAAFLDGSRPPARTAGSLRPVLANWITSPENPYFARMAVNRLWGHFFGIGLVEPVDDFSDLNPPSHPELLDRLAAEFVRHDYDLKFLIRAITGSQAFQRTSATPDGEEIEPRLFARMAVKGLTADQMFRSVAQATGYFEPFSERQSPRGGNDPRSEFEQLFEDNLSPPPERETSVLQALAMMNGGFVTDATQLEGSRTLSAVADYPLFSNDDRIETLYLAALSRRPRPDELARCRDYIDQSEGSPKQALADIFWALLNCGEFSFNH